MSNGDWVGGGNTVGAQNDISVLLQDVSRTEMRWRKFRESGHTVPATARQNALARWRREWRLLIRKYPDVDTQLDDMVGALLWTGNMTDYDPDKFAGNLRRALSNTIAQGRSVGVIKAQRDVAVKSGIEELKQAIARNPGGFSGVSHFSALSTAVRYIQRRIDGELQVSREARGRGGTPPPTGRHGLPRIFKGEGGQFWVSDNNRISGYLNQLGYDEVPMDRLSLTVTKTVDAKKSATLAGQIEVRVNGWRRVTPGKADAIKALDGWIRDAEILGGDEAVEVLRQAVADAERIGTVKAAASWDGVIAGIDDAVKSLRGTAKAVDIEKNRGRAKREIQDMYRRSAQGQMTSPNLNRYVSMCEALKDLVNDNAAQHLDDAAHSFRVAAQYADDKNTLMAAHNFQQASTALQRAWRAV